VNWVVDSALPVPLIVSGLPAIVPPVDVTLTAWPLSRAVIGLPTLSVTLTLALMVPLLPSPVTRR
jgi:hypothetical protein